MDHRVRPMQQLLNDRDVFELYGPTRSVVHPRACSVGGGTFATSQDGSRCVVAGKDVLRILRITDPSRSRSQSQGQLHNVTSEPNTRICSGPGGATIEIGPNMWSASGLKVDSAPTDVVWARGQFDQKIITSARNGEIVYWDLNRSGSKYETRIKEHTRAVNKLALSPFLPYIFASGSQDGYLRLWDLRSPPASIRKVYHPRGIRALSLCPVPSNPFTVFTGLESGNIQRWDLRGRPLPLERITLAHTSSVLSMDWLHPSTKETGLGWLVTSGMDRRVKIWNFNHPPGANLPVPASERDNALLNKKIGPHAFRTLHTPFPVRNVIWRPGSDTEVVIVSNNESESETLEIWDIRRSWIGKWAMEGIDGGITDIAFPTLSSHKLWALHSNGAFAQYDIRPDDNLHRPLDSIPRVALSWTPSGDLAFVTNRSKPQEEVPFDDATDTHLLPNVAPLRSHTKPTSSPIYVPYQQTLGVQSIPNFDPETFEKLAREYVWEVVEGRKRRSICEINAEKAREVGRIRAAQTWSLLFELLTDLDTEEGTKEPSIAMTPSIQPPSHTHVDSYPHRTSAPTSVASRPSTRAPSVDANYADSRIKLKGIPSSLSKARQSSSPSPRPAVHAPRSNQLWPIVTDPSSRCDASVSSNNKSAYGSRRSSTVQPSPGHHVPRPTIRRASMSVSLSVDGSPVQSITTRSAGIQKHAFVGEGALDDSDSDSDSDSIHSGSGPATSGSVVSEENASNPTAPTSSPIRILGGGIIRGDSPDHDGNLAGDEKSLVGEEYDSDASDDDSHSPPSTPSTEGRGSRSGSGFSSPRRLSPERTRMSRSVEGTSTQVIMSDLPRFSSIRTRTPHLVKQESQSSIRTVTVLASDKEMVVVKDESEGGVSTRRPSPRSGHALGLTNMGVTPTVEEPAPLRRLISEEVKEAEVCFRDIGWRILRDATEEFAELGDVQMCALLAIVAPDELGIKPVRAARFVDAYVDILSRLQLHSLAAHVRKYAPYDSIKSTTQVQTTIYSSCGKCRTPIKVSSPGRSVLCNKCKSRPTLCAVCHLPVRRLLIHCTGCGHGGHQTCYRTFYFARPPTEILTSATLAHASISDSHSSTDTSSTTYYSFSDGEREPTEEREDDADSEKGKEDSEKSKEDIIDYETIASKGSPRRPKMRVLGHPCAAGCGHWCWATNERFTGV